MNIVYQEFKPSAALQPYVDCYWLHTFGEGDPTEWSPLQRCLPFGMIELIVHLDDNLAQAWFDDEWKHLPRIFMAGMYRDTVLIRGRAQTRKFGIRMKPELFTHLFKAPPSALYSLYTELENITGRECERLADQLAGAKDIREILAITEAYLLAQLQKSNEERSYVTEAIQLIRSSKGDISIEALSKSVYVSVRQLQRGFRDTLGTSPKTYGRIVRFRNAYLSMQQLEQNGGSWTGLSYDLGYADQAHFIREFKEFSGIMPNTMRMREEQVYGKI